MLSMFWPTIFWQFHKLSRGAASIDEVTAQHFISAVIWKWGAISMTCNVNTVSVSLLVEKLFFIDMVSGLSQNPFGLASVHLARSLRSQGENIYHIIVILTELTTQQFVCGFLSQVSYRYIGRRLCH